MAFKLVSSNEIYQCPFNDCGSPEYWTEATDAHDNIPPYYHAAHGYVRNKTNTYWGAAQLDGRWLLKDWFVNWYQVAAGDYGYDAVTDRLMLLEHNYHTINGKVFLCDWDVPVYHDKQLTVWNTADPEPYPGMIRLADRYLKATVASGSTRISSCPLDRSTDWVTEVTATDDIDYPNEFCITPAAESGHVWVCTKDGKALLYDADNQTIIKQDYNFYDESGSRWGHYYASFVRELGVFVVGRWTGTYPGPYLQRIQVYVPEIEPYTLTDPIALDTVQTGYASRIRVTLTGQHSEPIEGHDVDWLITGGTGALSASQSRTDASGNAEVYYIPTSTSTTVTIQAQVAY